MFHIQCLNVQTYKAMNKKNNKEAQSAMVPITIGHLLNYGVKPGDQLQLEFFFYGTELEKARQLADVLQIEYGYETYDIHETNSKWSVMGLTTPIPILTEMVQEWAEEMCVLGDRFEFEFDGWGTLA